MRMRFVYGATLFLFVLCIRICSLEDKVTPASNRWLKDVQLLRAWNESIGFRRRCLYKDDPRPASDSLGSLYIYYSFRHSSRDSITQIRRYSAIERQGCVIRTQLLSEAL
jgi:hypothetical protein